MSCMMNCLYGRKKTLQEQKAESDNGESGPDYFGRADAPAEEDDRGRKDKYGGKRTQGGDDARIGILQRKKKKPDADKGAEDCPGGYEGKPAPMPESTPYFAKLARYCSKKNKSEERACDSNLCSRDRMYPACACLG